METELVEPIEENLKYNLKDIQGVITSTKLTCCIKKNWVF